MIENFAHVRVFSYHHPIKDKNYDFYLSILISESWAPFFWATPCINSRTIRMIPYPYFAQVNKCS